MKQNPTEDEAILEKETHYYKKKHDFSEKYNSAEKHNSKEKDNSREKYYLYLRELLFLNCWKNRPWKSFIMSTLVRLFRNI